MAKCGTMVIRNGNKVKLKLGTGQGITWTLAEGVYLDNHLK